MLAGLGAGVMSGLLERLLERARDDFPALVFRLAADQPDAVCYDAMTLAGKMAAMGVPIVAYPLQPEQEANARRLEDLGLGRRLPADGLTAALIHEVVAEVGRDQEIRGKVAAMSQRVRNSGGATAAADAMEHYLLSQRGV
jgi:hypothetical protein